MSSGKTNRTKGHNYERYLSKVFRDMGYPHCKTSRQASRLYDDCGIDLWGIPFAIQAKNGYINNRIKPDIEFRKITENIIKNFPKESNEFKFKKILFNKLDGYKNENHLVTMQFAEFIEMLAQIKFCAEILTDEQVKIVNNKIEDFLKKI